MIKLTSTLELDAHVVRMLDEANELVTKIKALNLFIQHNSIFDKLSIEEQELMRQQLHAMKEYYKALTMRIIII